MLTGLSPTRSTKIKWTGTLLVLQKGPSRRHLWGKIFTKTLAQLILAPPGQGPVEILMSHELGGPC